MVEYCIRLEQPIPSEMSSIERILPKTRLMLRLTCPEDDGPRHTDGSVPRLGWEEVSEMQRDGDVPVFLLLVVIVQFVGVTADVAV